MPNENPTPAPSEAPEGGAPPSPAPAPAAEATAPPGTIAGGAPVEAPAPEVPADGAPPPEASAAPPDPATLPPASADAYDLKLPDGATADEAALADLRATAFEAKLPNAVAQKFIDLHFATLAKAQEAMATQFTALSEGWRNETMKFPEFQGERAAQSSAALGSLIERFGTPGLKSTLNETQMGNNPDLVRLLLNVAEALGEGTPTGSGTPGALAGPNGTSRGRSLGQRLYPDLQS